MTYTAVVKQDGSDWIGWIEEIPGVNCQEGSYEELMETLSLTLKEAIAFNTQDAIRSAGTNYHELVIQV